MAASFKKNQSIGIIGQGFVGRVLKSYYPDAKVYDIAPGNWDNLENVLAQNYIFIAVNFKDNGLSDKSRGELEKYFSKMPAGRKVIFKSTLVPGVTDYFQELYPKLFFCFNPEFLTEATAWEDFTQPQFQILGFPKSAPEFSDELFELLPDAAEKKVMSAREAETLKHAQNSYYAMKVVFFNQLYDACLNLGADYEKIREILIKNPWIGDSHTIIWHKGYRGFSGKCLPKDIKAFLTVTDLPLLKTVLEINSSLTSQTPLELPEKTSEKL
ncbi:hypothetical protein HYW53_03100 [Candidatus Giovannonibacteria bacterium]|nr:hypothetical protein [Candidatus Giovannonibacteria bacterium]